MTAREKALAIWRAGVESVRPAPLCEVAVQSLARETTGRILVVGAGKASGEMALGIERGLADQLHRVSGWVNVPEGTSAQTQKIHLHPARPQGSNSPTEAGVFGSRQILDLVKSGQPDDLVLCLISGGGSALLPLPVDDIMLQDKQEITKLLAASGATIQELNCVRKHLSQIKGGQLAAACPTRLVSLIISDVVGDPLDVIGSGPTVPDPTTFHDAWSSITSRGVLDQAPKSVVEYLLRGTHGHAPETPKTLHDSIENHLLGTNAVALQAAKLAAERLGYQVISWGSDSVGETQTVARQDAERLRAYPPGTCVLAGGETTVTLSPNPGLGGRNQEYALAMLDFYGEHFPHNLAILSAGTDGEDGPTDAAGAFADRANFDASATDFLKRHDAYHYFERHGSLVKTGLTGTNVMDLRVILMD
ncbi:MAG: glycerate kinase type-2 family protein [Fimbriiglobus sp.]